MCIEQTKVTLTKGQSAEELLIRQINNGMSERVRNIKSILENTIRRTHDIHLNMLKVFLLPENYGVISDRLR